VWALVSDVTRMPELSEELQSVRWVDGAVDPAARGPVRRAEQARRVREVARVRARHDRRAGAHPAVSSGVRRTATTVEASGLGSWSRQACFVSGGSVTNRLVTDLDSRCRSRTTWSGGGVLEQNRLGETDYVRPNRAYLQKWKNYPGLTDEQKLWVRTPVDPAGRGGDGLASCERPFDSFGTARKDGSSRVEGTKAVESVVTDKADKAGTYTFFVAAEGRPYLLRTVYKSAAQHTTTSFSGFDEPLDIRAPKAGEVLSVPGGS
jgi:hypothetical protein